MKKIYILALSALAVAVSCQKTSEIPETESSEPIIRTVTCTIAADDSKVDINPANGKTTWVKGDKILIHGKKTSEDVVVTLEEENILNEGKTASFSVEFPATSYLDDKEDPCGYYAAYPAEAYIENSSGRGYHYNTFSETNLPLMSAYFNATENTFGFHNLCGLISFKVTGDYDSYILTGNGNETVGYSKYAVKTTKNDTNYHHGSTSGELKSISGPLVADGVTENRIFFPNGVSFTGGFTIKFLEGGVVEKTLSTTKPVTVARAEYRPMGDVTDLSATASANCYIIDGSNDANADKVFTFKAYQGNSEAGVGSIASASIVWETYNTADAVTANTVIAAVDFDKQEANEYYTMVFKMPATLHAGNALIAANDAGGNILWSWHIWVPSTAISTITDATVFGGTIMDRNLGALVAAPAAGAVTVQSYGLLYQWGRKDPFPGMDAIEHNGQAAVAGTAMSALDGTMKMEDAIKNPTKFIKSSEGKDWAEDPNNAYWSSSKSIYDPCPQGYIVPNRNTSALYWSGTNLDALDASANFVDNYKTDASYLSYQLGTSTAVVFPYTGYIQMGYGDHYKAGIRSYVWSSYASSYKGNVDVAYSVFAERNKEYRRVERGKSLGAAVRCVAE